MKKQFYRVSAAAVALLVGMGATGAQSATLSEAIAQALGFNPRIKAADSNREAVNYELRQSRSFYLPQVDATAGIGVASINDSITRSSGTDDYSTMQPEEYGIILQQRLFDGFETDSLVARDKARFKAASRRVYETSEFLALDVTESYLNVVRSQSLLALAEENARIHEAILDSLRQRGSGGVGNRADIDQTEARLLRARSVVEDTENSLQDARASYTALVGELPPALDAPGCPTGSIPPGEAETLAQLIAQNPTLRALDADVEANDARVDLSESPLYPRLSVEASSTYRDDQDGAETWEWDNRVMLMMRWNLYSGGRDAAGKREAVARLGQSKFERSVALLQAEEETRQSWNALRASQRRTGLLTDAVGSSRATRDAYREQFRVGNRTLLDVLDAENEVFVVSSELVDSQTVECFQQYRILALTGGLLRSVDVAAPATTDETPPSFEDTILVE